MATNGSKKCGSHQRPGEMKRVRDRRTWEELRQEEITDDDFGKG